MRRAGLASAAAAVLLAATFIVIAGRVLDVLPWEYDEGTAILQARAVRHGLRPFVDFAHHQPPLHLYLLALSAKVFGPTVFGYRMLSVASIGLGSLFLFALTRPFVGALPALVAQAAFLFSPSQLHALDAVAEAPMLCLTLLGVTLLFLGKGRPSAWASAVAFVAALLVKPTCLLLVLAAAMSLVYARAWPRLRQFALAGTVAALAGLAWVLVLSDGVFADLLRFHLQRLGTRNAGMWSVDSGFSDLRRIFGIESRSAWALFCFKVFRLYPETYVPTALLVLAVLGVPIWLLGCARDRPALRAFVLLWPLSYVLLDFVALDYVSAKYFVPFLGVAAFLLAGVVWRVQRTLPRSVATAGALVACVALAGQFAVVLGRQIDPWYYGRATWIAQTTPSVVSFTPMIFAATGSEPACDFVNPAITYGGYGEAVLEADARTRGFRFTDERLVECLRTHPETKMVVDFWYYFYTRPGSSLRRYLDAEGSAQRLFFSPEALAQWEHPRLVKDFVFR